MALCFELKVECLLHESLEFTNEGTFLYQNLYLKVKQILSKDDVKSTVNVAKPGFTPFVSVNIKFHPLKVNIK